MLKTSRNPNSVPNIATTDESSFWRHRKRSRWKSLDQWKVFGPANFKLREPGRERSMPYAIELASTSSNLRIASTMSGLQLVATKPWNRL